MVMGRYQSLVEPGKTRVRGGRKSKARDLKTGGQQFYHSHMFREDSLRTASI